MNIQNMYLINFSLAKKYRGLNTKEHYPFNNNIIMTITTKYALINAMKGYKQSRRDDLKSLGYVFYLFFKRLFTLDGIKK